MLTQKSRSGFSAKSDILSKLCRQFVRAFDVLRRRELFLGRLVVGRQDYIDFGLALVNGCHSLYNSTLTGMYVFLESIFPFFHF